MYFGFRVQVADSDEVSTGSGSDRVTASISNHLSHKNPVATAPGTDLMKNEA
jgi:hypothetical protein